MMRKRERGRERHLASREESISHPRKGERQRVKAKGTPYTQSIHKTYLEMGKEQKVPVSLAVPCNPENQIQ